jgi:hypothetical protein
MEEESIGDRITTGSFTHEAHKNTVPKEVEVLLS